MLQINIINNEGIDVTFQNDTKKRENRIKFSELKNQIKLIFTEEFERLFPIFSPTPSEIRISLEQNKNAENKFNALTFLSEQSTAQTFRFSIPYHALMLFHDALNDENNKAIEIFHNIVLRQLICAADMENALTKEALAHQLYNHQTVQNTPQTETSSPHEYKYEVLLAFTDFIATYRSEGIGILGEILFSKHHREFPSRKNAFSTFKNDFHEVLKNASELSRNSVQTKIRVFNAIDSIKTNATNYSPFILIEILKERKLISHEIADILLDELENKAYTIIDNDHKIDIIRKAIKMDFSEFINGLLLIRNRTDEHFLLDINEFLRYCDSILSHEQNTGSDQEQLIGKQLIAQIFNKNHYPDAESYLDALRKNISKPLNDEEIDSFYSDFINCKKNDEIVADLKNNASFLYQIYKSNKNEIAQYALSYLLNSDDFIDDNISLIGWQDDWLVVNAAVNILKKDYKNL